MANTVSTDPADFIVPLNINGMDGRMLHVPGRPGSDPRKEILFVYGHHSSLERWWGLVQVLNKYGAVTMPDLPGFGGMDSYYTIGRKPTLDNMADYLAAFIKLRYKRKKCVLAGMSFGFIVATRMLQRYPELTNKVILLVSIVGFAHHEDFTFSKPRYYGYLFGTRLLSRKVPSTIFRYTALNSTILRNFYGKTHNAKHKFAQAKDAEDLEHLKNIEVGLWHDNDVRTWAFTTKEFLIFDNCRVRVDLPVVHVSVTADHFFDNNLVEQHMRVIFSDFDSAEVASSTHAPSVIADAKTAAPMVPQKLRRKLKKVMK